MFRFITFMLVSENMRFITFTAVYLTVFMLVMVAAILGVKVSYIGEYETLIWTLLLDWIFVAVDYVLWLIRREVI